MVTFFEEDIVSPKIEESKFKGWLEKIARTEGFEIKSINYIFCSDEYLLKINNQYLNHDYYTDIITFPMEKNPIVADIFISVERVHENAKDMQIGFELELKRVMAHGLLHLCGYDDKDDDNKQAMRKAEDRSLELF